MTELGDVRRRIDEIDVDIIEKICLRMEYAKEIGKMKKEMGLDIRDESRENTLTRRWEELAKVHSCPMDKLTKILDDILDLSRYLQETVE